MDLPDPVFCRPQAYRLLAEQLPVLETTNGLVRAATALAMHELDDADPRLVDRQITDLVDVVRGRVRSSDIQAVLAHAHDVLFEEVGFVGNATDYYNPRNSYLPMVIKTRQGLPITLTLIYKAVLERLGVRVMGINAPGHFMAGVELAEANGSPTLMLVDPFHGGKVLSREEALELVEQVQPAIRHHPDAALQPATHRQWLLRMLTNLMMVFDRLGRRESMGAMAEMQALVENHRQ